MCRWDVSGRRRRSRRRPYSWPPTAPDTSPAAPCMSTAACTWIDAGTPTILVDYRACSAGRPGHHRGATASSRPREGTLMESVEQRVKKIVAEQLGVNEADVKNESTFVDDLGADSLDTVELVMALEEEFECEIPDEEAEKITSVQQAIDYIKAHLN